MTTLDATSPERELVRGAFDEVFAAPSAMTVDEWSDKHRIVVGSDEPGPWRTRRTPHTRGPMRAWTDPGVDTLILMYAAQQCKTETIFNCLMYDADVDPHWWMFVYPDFEACKLVNKKRLIPSLKATPRMAEKFSGARDDATVTEISLGQNEVFFAWAGSDSRLKSTPIQRLAEDEIDEFPDGADALVKDRIKAASRPKRIRTSTPTFKGVGIDAAYDASDRRRFDRPCPHCRVYREWLWADVAWGVIDADGTFRGGSRCTKQEASGSAHVVCPECKGRIDDHHRDGMNVRGVWVREGERVEYSRDFKPELDPWTDDPELGGMHLNCPIPWYAKVVGEPKFPGRTAGFRANSLISPFAGSRVGKMVEAFAEAGFRMTKEFARGWLGEAWEDKGEKVEESVLAERCVPVSRGGYRFGTVPAWANVLLGWIDVQHDACYLGVRAYAPRAEKSAMVWYERIPAPEAHRLAELDAVPSRSFPREGGGFARVLMWAIDSGHRLEQVLSLATRHQSAYDRLMVVRGQAETVRPDPYWIVTGENSKGRTLPVPVMNVNVGFFKDEVFAQLQDDQRWLLPSGCPREYLEQVTAEWRSPVVQTVSPGGSRGARYEKPGSRTRWVLRPGKKENHAWDGETYTSSLAFRFKMHQCTSNLLGSGAVPTPLPEMPSMVPVRNPALPPQAPPPPTPAVRTSPRRGQPSSPWMGRRRR